MCVLTDIIKQPLLDQEINNLATEAINAGKYITPNIIFTIANQILQINSVSELQSYLREGNGLTKKESGEYIGCLLLQYTNQIN